MSAREVTTIQAQTIIANAAAALTRQQASAAGTIKTYISTRDRVTITTFPVRGRPDLLKVQIVSGCTC